MFQLKPFFAKLVDAKFNWTLVATCLLWIATSVQTASAATPKILVVGDSLSAAYQIPAETGWVNLLSLRVQDKKLAEVINASFGGATTAAGVQRLPTLLQQHNPDIMLLELGGNDGLQGKPVPYITNNLKKMIELAQAKDVQVVLLGIRIPPNYGSKYTEPFFAQYASLASEYNLLYVPFILAGVAENRTLMQADGIHPTAQAQPMILDNIWPTLEPLLIVEP